MWKQVPAGHRRGRRGIGHVADCGVRNAVLQTGWICQLLETSAAVILVEAKIAMPFTYDYPRPAVSADVVVLDVDSNSILLIQRANEPFAGHWALPGGFMEMDESADAAAIRELKEETGLVVDQVQQIGAYSSVDRDPRGRVVTVAFFATASKSDHVLAADDADEARWFHVDELPNLAFDHAQVVSDCLNRFAQ